MADLTDDQLVNKFQRGFQKGKHFSTLYNRYVRYVSHIARKMMDDEENVRDITQETFVKAFSALEKFEGRAGAGFKTWLTQIALNTCRSRLREKRSRREEFHDSIDDPEGKIGDIPAEETESNPETRLIENEQKACVLEEMAELSEVERQTIELYGRYSSAEIAEITNVPIGTVCSRIYNIKKKVRERLLKKGLL